MTFHNFKFKAATHQGEIKRGYIQAPTPQGAEQILTNQGLHVIWLRSQAIKHKAWVKKSTSLSHQTLLEFIMQLHALVAAHIALPDAMKCLQEIYDRGPLGNLLVQATDRLWQGESLAKALSHRAGLFPPIALQVISLGEAHHQLPEALSAYSKFLKQRINLSGQTRKALAYPFFLMILFGSLAAFLSIYLLPQMSDFLKQNGQGSFLFSEICEFLTAWGPGLLGGALGVFTILVPMGFFNPKLRLYFSKKLLGIPLVGQILLLENIQFYTLALKLLTSTGLELPQGVARAHSFLKSTYLKKQLGGAEKSLLQGKSLFLTLQESQVFPPVPLRLLKIGEQTGRLPWALEEIDAYLQERLANRIELIGRWMEPTLLILMGAVLLTIVFSIFLPLYSSLGGII